MKSLILHSAELRSLLSTGRCEVRRRVRPQPEFGDGCDYPAIMHGSYGYDTLEEFIKYMSPIGSPGEVLRVKRRTRVMSRSITELVMVDANIGALVCPASRLNVRVVAVSVERVDNEWWWVGEMEVSK